jgi:hypothetical protein
MSIAQQVATPTPSRPARRPSGPLQPAPVRRPGRALVRIFGLIALTALGVSLTLGTIAVAVLLVASNLAG